jgi:transposase
MMTQEEYVNQVLALQRQGKTITEIAHELGYHPATVSGWLKKGGPPPKRTFDPAERVIDDRWKARISELIQPPTDKLLSTSIHAIISAEGFRGSYVTVARHVRELRGSRFRAPVAVSMPIETAPGVEAQFDFSDCSDWTVRWGLGEVFCLGCILCWSRWRRWWFTTSEDREHTFEGLVAFFEAVGGVPRIGRTDRMGALGQSQGRRFRLHPPAIDFARHHGLEFAICQTRDAARKGKTERPFRDMKETFLTECDALGAPTTIAELNARAQPFLTERVHARPHSATGEPPAARLEVERRFLAALPRRRYDTAYVETRRVHPRFPLVEWDKVPYSVPPEVVGSVVTCRVQVDSDELVIAWGARQVARHRLRPGATEPVWDPDHRAAAEAIALGRARSHLTVLPPCADDADDRHDRVDRNDRAVAPRRLELGEGDYDVDDIDLQARYGACGCTGEGA